MTSLPAPVRTACAVLLLAGCLSARPLVAQDADLANGVDLTVNPAFPPPTLLYSDVLNALQSHVTWSRGVLQVDGTIRALFLPDCHTDQSIYAYNPDSGAKLAHQLKTADGTVVLTQFYTAEKEKPPFWLVHPPLADDTSLASGDYVLEWLIEGTPFYRFPFTVEAAASGDVYNPETRYFFEGPWEDYAYLYIADNSPSSTPTFSIWLRDKQSTTRLQEHPVNITVTRGNQPVAFWPGPDEASPVGFRPFWERHDAMLRDAGRGVFRAEELMKDGSYTVTVTIDGTVYGRYPFTARDGVIQHQDRQVRESTDPLTYIEGDTQRFFMKRVR